DWLKPCVVKYLWLVNRNYRALDLVGEAAVISEILGNIVDLPSHFSAQLAVVARLRFSQRVDVAFDQFSELGKESATIARRKPGPWTFQRAHRRTHSTIHILRV